MAMVMLPAQLTFFSVQEEEEKISKTVHEAILFLRVVEVIEATRYAIITSLQLAKLLWEWEQEQI